MGGTVDILGSTVAGRYRVEAELGSGGQADVFRAHDATTGRPVALKVLRAGPDEIGSQARFRREFLVCSRLRHPGVVRLYDFGDFDGGHLYCAMELFTCPTLAETIEREGPMGEGRALHGARQMAEALACLHDAGVVHRDLKPANVFVDGDRFVLTDFGLAYEAGRTRMTQTGTMLGTPHYMAPEQVRGEPADGRTDLFQLGLLILEMLTGRRVHGDSSLQEVLTSILTRDPPPPSSRVPGLDPRWDSLVARLCAREPSKRFGTAAEALAALGQMGRPPGSTPPVEVPSEVRASPTFGGRLLPRTRFAVALGAVVAMLVAGVAVLRGPGGTSTALGLQVESCPGVLVARWSSDRPYPSRVRCRLPDGSVREASTGTAATSHVVVVEGLPGGADVEVTVVYPSGESSMGVSAQTGRSVLKVVASSCGSDSVDITFESRPVRASLLRFILTDGRQVTEPLVFGEGDGFMRARIAVTPALVAGAVLEDRAGAGVADVGELVTGAVAAVLRRIPVGTLLRLVDGVGAVMQPGTEVLAARFDKRDPDGRGSEALERVDVRRRQAGMQDFLAERLAGPELKAAWRSLMALAPLVLETRLLAPDLAQQTLETLLDGEGIFLGCAFEGVDADLVPLDPLPALPSLRRGSRGLEGAVSFPVFIPTAAPPLLGLAFPLAPREMVTRLQGTAAIGLTRDVTAAEVAVAVQGFHKLPLLVLVDGRPAARLVGAPVLPLGHKVTTWLHQRIPPFTLRRDPVTVTLVPEVLLQRRTNNRVVVHGVSLRVLRR